MIIGIWILMVIFLVIVFGEIKYHYFDKSKNLKENKIVCRDWEDHVDTDMDKLSMEQTDDEFVSTHALAMRGSWRLAQNQVMGRKSFHMLRSQEYNKML